MLVHLGAMFGQLGAILEQLGDKMRPKSAKERRKRSEIDVLGAKDVWRRKL